MWRRVCIVLLLLPSWLSAEELAVSVGVEQFQWAEYANSGRELLVESGQRYLVEIRGSEYLGPQSADFSARFYSGTVDYDGETMSGSPFQTDTDYNGYQAELGLSYAFADAGQPHNAKWLLRFALGVDRWRRAIQDGVLPDGSTPVSGYVERYSCNYFRLGTAYQAADGWEISVGAKVPLQTTERLVLWGREYVLHPEGQLSLYAGASVAIARQWDVSVGYDSYRFSRSDPDASGSLYQPRSEQDTLLLALRLHF